MTSADSFAPIAASGSSRRRIFASSRVALRERDGLSLAARQRLDEGVDARDADVDVIQVLTRQTCRIVAVRQPPEPPEAGDLTVEEEVLVDGERRDERQVLVDGLDAVRTGILHRVELDRVPLDEDPARILAVEAAEDLHERALAAAVVADEPEHLAAPEMDVDAAQDDERAEPLRDPFCPKDDVRSVRCTEVARGCARRRPVGPHGAAARRGPSLGRLARRSS